MSVQHPKTEGIQEGTRATYSPTEHSLQDLLPLTSQKVPRTPINLLELRTNVSAGLITDQVRDIMVRLCKHLQRYRQRPTLLISHVSPNLIKSTVNHHTSSWSCMAKGTP